MVNANKKLCVVTGVLGEKNVTTYHSFPAGYTSANCVTVSMMVYVSSDYIGNAINQNWAYISFDSSRIVIVARDDGVVGKTFKLLLCKME